MIPVYPVRISVIPTIPRIPAIPISTLVSPSPTIGVVIRIVVMIKCKIPRVVIVSPKSRATKSVWRIVPTPSPIPTKWAVVYDVHIYPVRLITPRAMCLIVSRTGLFGCRTLILFGICENIIVLNALGCLFSKVIFIV